MSSLFTYSTRIVVGLSAVTALLAYSLRDTVFQSVFPDSHVALSSAATAEVLIVGGSHAGLSAALTLARHQIDVLIVDSNAPRNKWKTPTHVVPTWEHRNPDDLRRASREELRKTGFARFVDAHVTTIKKPGTNESLFVASDSHGGAWSGRKLLIATGVEFIFPPIEGYEENFPDRM